MRKKKVIFLKQCIFFLFILSAINLYAWSGMAMPRLHVEGRYLKDTQGNIVNLHGFAQTYSPWFNEQGKYWTNYNVSGCLKYNKGIIDQVMAAGWKMSFIRIHMDPYWSNTPGLSVTGESDISAFNFTRFKTYLNSVFIPMAEYAISKGLYVVMRPPGVCPDSITVGDAYNKYLIKVWGYVTQQSKLKNNPNVLFELANEPVGIYKSDRSSGGFDDLKKYFQSVVDTIRASCDNIVLVPGLGWQSQYQGFAEYPVKGGNVGYAVHVYPGWFNSGNGYAAFQKGWDNQVKPAANFAPIVVTEMDWAPAKYNSSWGKDSTGVAGGNGFGANFKKITDASGNVSWLIFTDANLLAQYTGVATAQGDTATFLNDPQACPWPTFHWYQDYANANYPRPDFTYQSKSDNGDGTFTNPIIQADFPDPDVIRVGATYYMVTTTMHNFPGCTLLKSKDLVNWDFCCNPLEKMSSNSEYNLESGKNIYSKGAWANSLMYKNGKFYILFNAFGNGDDAGGYLLTATNPEETWAMKRLSRGYYDPGLLVDEDNTVYVVCGNTNLSVIQLDDDFNPVGTEHAVDGGFSGLEGSHFIKKDGYYYIYSTCCTWPATQWCFRSTNVFGPYEKKEVFDNDDIHQGALIKTQTGEWWTMLMRDCGAFGRMPYLEPVTWTDNWPIIGVNDAGVTTYTKPNVGKSYISTVLPTNDNFRNYKIGMQWQWNHNPDNSKWSLFERTGYLRLYTACVTDSFQQARNTLTQRIYGYHSATVPSYGTIRMDVRNMKDGDIAGLAVFQDPYAFIGVNKVGDKIYIVQRNKATRKNYSTEIDCDSIIYLRAVATYGTSKASFYYSLDNTTYTNFGEDLNMKYNLSVFVGNRFCLFNYATKAEGGFVDVDWFSTDLNFSEDTFYDNNFTAYSSEALTTDDIYADKTSYTLLLGSSKSFTLTAHYKDGHTSDITTDASYSTSKDGVINIINGRLVGVSEGTTTITATYKDLLGNVCVLDIPITVSIFPFTADIFNPSIYTTGTYDETTHTLKTGQYGFGGWSYSNGLDLSSYTYLVVQLASAQICNASFRIFDENSYWSTPFMVDFGTSTKIVVNLQTMKKNGTTTACNPAHIYIIGFWTIGSSSIKIKDVSLSNDSTTLVGIKPVLELNDENGLVDVYSITGICLRSQVKRKNALSGLRSGFYIVDNKLCSCEVDNNR